MAKTKKDVKSLGKDSLDAVLQDIKTKYGEGAIMKLGEAPKVDVDAIPTGSLDLDFALGVGGVPQGRIIEIFVRVNYGMTCNSTSSNNTCISF